MSHKKSSKKKCKRLALKRALKWISSATHDSMRAARRGWGIGEPK